MKKCIPIINPTVTTVTGTSVTLTFPAAITTVTLADLFKIPAILPQLLGTTTGTEEVIISIGATTYPLLDNLGKLITSQMLRRAMADCDEVRAKLMVIQVGISGAATVFYGRRGFCKRRTTVDAVTPPVAT